MTRIPENIQKHTQNTKGNKHQSEKKKQWYFDSEEYKAIESSNISCIRKENPEKQIRTQKPNNIDKQQSRQKSRVKNRNDLQRSCEFQRTEWHTGIEPEADTDAEYHKIA